MPTHAWPKHLSLFIIKTITKLFTIVMICELCRTRLSNNGERQTAVGRKSRIKVKFCFSLKIDKCQQNEKDPFPTGNPFFLGFLSFCQTPRAPPVRSCLGLEPRTICCSQNFFKQFNLEIFNLKMAQNVFSRYELGMIP